MKMGILETIKKNQIPAKQPVIKAKKKLHKMGLYGHISNGGGIIKLDEEYALKFIALDNNYVIVHLLDYGKDIDMVTQTWQKIKEVKRQKKKLIIENDDDKENLF